MAAISKIKLPSGTTYDIHDSRVDNINSFDYVVSTDAATTPKDVVWDKSGTTITGTLVAAQATMYKIYLVPSVNGTNDIYDEYITVKTVVSGSNVFTWEMFGNTKLPDMNDYVKNASGHSGGTAGALAYKGSASGTVAVPKTFTTTVTPVAKNVSVTGTTTGSVSVTKGIVDVKPNTTGTAANKYTPEGTVTSTFNGSALTSTGSFTPAGTISLTNGNKTATVSAASSGTATYTPAGSVSTPTITVTPKSETVYVATSATSGGQVTAGTAASCTLPTYTVESGTETLVISAGSFSANTPTAVTLPSFSSKSVVTGITSATSTQPTFTGTGARLVTGNISVPTSASFNGTAGTVSVSGTPAGEIESTFAGTDTYLKTAVEVVTGASFAGASMTSTGSYTPATPTASTTIATTENKTVTVS